MILLYTNMRRTMIMPWHCTAALTWYDAIYCFVYGRPLTVGPAEVDLPRLYQVPDHNYLTERELNCCGTVLWVDLVQSASASCESSSRGRAGCCIWSREGQSGNPRQSWYWFLKCRQPGQDQPHRLHLRLQYMFTWGQRSSVGAQVYNSTQPCHHVEIKTSQNKWYTCLNVLCDCCEGRCDAGILPRDFLNIEDSRETQDGEAGCFFKDPHVGPASNGAWQPSVDRLAGEPASHSHSI